MDGAFSEKALPENAGPPRQDHRPPAKSPRSLLIQIIGARNSSRCILYCSVVRLTPRRSAAPDTRKGTPRVLPQNVDDVLLPLFVAQCHVRFGKQQSFSSRSSPETSAELFSSRLPSAQ